MIKKLLGLSFLGIGILLLACNKESDFATFLVEGDKVEVSLTKFDLKAKTVTSDSVRTFNDSIFIPGYFIGTMTDPYFGTAKASIVFQTRISAEADFGLRARLDSVVLSIAYDTVQGGYGALNEPHGFEVFRLRSDLNLTDSYFSNTEHDYDTEPLGSISGVIPNFGDTISVIEPVGNRIDTNLYDPHIRIPLDSTFGQELLSLEELDLVNNEALLQKLKGLVVKPTGNTGGMVFLDMEGGLTRINLYYSKGDTAKHFVFSANAQSVITNLYDINPSGAVVDQVFDDEEAGDSLLYLQSMGGTELEFTIPDLSELENTTINNAYIDLTLARLPEDDTSSFPPFSDILAQQRQEDGTLVLITDVARFVRSNTYSNVYGLMTDDATGRQYFRVNMTEYITRVLKGEVSSQLVLSNLTSASEPTRAIFYGPGHSQFKASLNITHSEFSSN